MKVGDLVQPKKGPLICWGVGLVIDCMEMDDGFYEFEVQFEHGVEWVSDLEMEMVDERR